MFTTAHATERKSIMDTVAIVAALMVLIVGPLHVLHAAHAPADWPSHSAGNFNPGAVLDDSEVTTTH